MRGVHNRVILVGRALTSGGATLHRVVPYATCSSSNPQLPSHKLLQAFGLSDFSAAAAGFRHSSTAATSLAQDLQAKGFPRSEDAFKSKELVLFQYEACPFCNKVKGQFHFLPC